MNIPGDKVLQPILVPSESADTDATEAAGSSGAFLSEFDWENLAELMRGRPREKAAVVETPSTSASIDAGAGDFSLGIVPIRDLSLEGLQQRR